MSYFIANAITISKDKKIFKVKGGDNNVIPRFNEWSGDIPIERLYYDINSGGIQIRAKNENALCILHSAWNIKYEGDYYRDYGLLSKTKGEIIEQVKNLKKEIDNKYYLERARELEKILPDFEENKAKFDKFNKDFLEKLKYNLANKPKGEYIICVDNNKYLGKKTKRGYTYYHEKSFAKKYKYYRAMNIKEDIMRAEIIKVGEPKKNECAKTRPL